MPDRNLPEPWRRNRNLWNPIREMNRLQQRMERMFDDFYNASFASDFGLSPLLWEPLSGEEYMPTCDAEETDTHYLFSFDLPGVKKGDVKIDLKDNQLIVSGERKEERRGRRRRESYYGAFSRSFVLPSNVKADQIEANYENGVLQVVIPKKEVSKGKQIPIKEGKLLESKIKKGKK